MVLCQELNQYRHGLCNGHLIPLPPRNCVSGDAEPFPQLDLRES